MGFDALFKDDKSEGHIAMFPVEFFFPLPFPLPFPLAAPFLAPFDGVAFLALVADFFAFFGVVAKISSARSE
jgi:hypothetical protein